MRPFSKTSVLSCCKKGFSVMGTGRCAVCLAALLADLSGRREQEEKKLFPF